MTQHPTRRAPSPFASLPSVPEAPGRRRALLALGSVGLIASGCGGSDDVAGVGSGGTGTSFTTGQINGFGSVIVNGIRYDDSSASVSDDLGNPLPLGRRGLGIGMIVEIQGTSDDRLGTGVANSIRTVSEIVGRIESIDRTASRLVVLGTTVQVAPTTLWEDVQGFDSLAVGNLVEIWGFADVSSGVLSARRIELKPVGSNAKLRGTVSSLDTVARTFQIGTQRVDYSALPTVTGLVDGIRVRVVGTVPAVGAAWRPERIELAGQRIDESTASVRLEGTISALQSGTRFAVGGIAVDASGAVFKDGTAASLRNGLRVRVKGTGASGGGVRAIEVDIRNSDGSSSSSSSSDDSAELIGTITRFASLSDFTLRDSAGREFPIDASNALLRDGTTLADLRVGAFIEVEGRAGTVFVAREVKLESSSSLGTVDLRGAIISYRNISDFTVRSVLGGDVAVDASGAQFLEGTTAADLRVGLFVEIEGRPGTVFAATKVKRES